MPLLPTDPFAVADPTERADSLFHLRRATHHFITRYGAALWATQQKQSGQLPVPAPIAALPAPQQPAALAADEAARFRDAHLYGLDETATGAAVTLGANMAHVSLNGTTPDLHRVWSPIAAPPTTSGLLRWASGIGYDALGVPVIAAHWGPIPGEKGTWLAFWADNRVAVSNDVQRGQALSQALLVLREIGPLSTTGWAVALRPCPDAGPPHGPSAQDRPPPPAHLLALTATVLGSWVLLTTLSPTRLITREPENEAAHDLRAGLSPRPATLATGPIDTEIIEHLYRSEQP